MEATHQVLRGLCPRVRGGHVCNCCNVNTVCLINAEEAGPGAWLEAFVLLRVMEKR